MANTLTKTSLLKLCSSNGICSKGSGPLQQFALLLISYACTIRFVVGHSCISVPHHFEEHMLIWKALSKITLHEAFCCVYLELASAERHELDLPAQVHAQLDDLVSSVTLCCLAATCSQGYLVCSTRSIVRLGTAAAEACAHTEEACLLLGRVQAYAI